ncbi:hypothetical protein H072_1267 [Dactylellina haptotyla CBS 200.50]|uniref:DNA-directed RNA polymerase III subunit RPC4 n=1 Tax=Dactylellina haptotyla (strain CBS 200.50) TaxID=1284197 RepID=S8CAG1_DACHA|nr:hypothetical protein H072_1267 [Dactylellina haptotyla CBS 200.50]
MPPKARGRPPRTRGGAAAAAASADESTNQQEVEQAVPVETAPESAMAIPPPSGRLEGLTNPPALRSSGRAAAASATAEVSAAAAATLPLLAPGERPKPKLKFAPKNTLRKTKEQRAELNRIYDPPPPDESLNAFGITRGGPSARGARGRGRGRGGSMGRGDTKREEVAVASGPFALGSVMTNGGKQKVSIERMGRSFRTGRSSGSSSRIKREGEDGSGVKDELYSSSDSEGGPKVDVEMIELISTDEEDEDGEGGERKHSIKGFAPVRIERHEHVDKTAAQPQTSDPKKKGDAAVKKKKGKGNEVEIEIMEERKSRGGRRDSGVGPRVKIESESPKATRRSTRSPEVKKKQSSSSPEDKRRKPKPRSRSRLRRNSGIVPQSQEDFEENDRFEVDRFSMLTELGPALPEQKPVDADGDHAMGEEADALPQPSSDEKENKLYLFQFPPILPVLEPVAAVEDGDSEIKQEEAGAAATADSSTNPTDPETGSKPVVAEAKAKKERFTSFEEIQRAKLPVGTAGKLQVHRSGRVTIIFGGVEFEVHRGVECEFLQDVVVLQKESGTLDERGKPKGRAWGMGQLKGKFVATPDISKLI